jgi:hypothetical protein
MTRLLYALFFGLVLGIPACESREAPAARPAAFELVAFSAPWCYACKKELPKVDAAATAKGAKLTIYIVTGPGPGSSPTQADADRYRHDLHFTAEVKPDPGARLYRDYVAQGNGYVPMGAALDTANGSVSRVFGPGRLDFDMVAYINQ